MWNGVPAPPQKGPRRLPFFGFKEKLTNLSVLLRSGTSPKRSTPTTLFGLKEKLTNLSVLLRSGTSPKRSTPTTLFWFEREKKEGHSTRKTSCARKLFYRSTTFPFTI